MGVSYSSSTLSSETAQHSLTVGMEMGMSYGIASGSASIEYEYSKSLRYDVQSTYGLDYSVDSTTTCAPEDG